MTFFNMEDFKPISNKPVLCYRICVRILLMKRIASCLCEAQRALIGKAGGVEAVTKAMQSHPSFTELLKCATREAIRFSAKLRLPRSTTADELDPVTEIMLQELGLVKCADTIVGGALIKGTRRAQENQCRSGARHQARPCFLDEPTSGLDSKCSKRLPALDPVFFTIHQRDF